MACDHRGFALKEKIKGWLAEWGFVYEDMGAFRADPDDDYPDFIARAAVKVSADPENSKAIILGHSGQGEAIAANKFKNVRAAVYYGFADEILTLSRQHNDANILSIGASFVTDEIKNGVKEWLETDFPHEPRHQRRIEKIKKLEEKL